MTVVTLSDSDCTILSMNECLTDGCVVDFLLQGDPCTTSLHYKGGCTNNVGSECGRD